MITEGENDAVWCLEIAHNFATRALFLDVLVHEMVHAWEHKRHRVMGHGKRFALWEKRIKRTVSLNLLEIIDESDYIDTQHGKAKKEN